MCLFSIVNLRPNLVISKRTSPYNEKIYNYQVNLIIHLLHKYTLNISLGQILEIKRYQQESKGPIPGLTLSIVYTWSHRLLGEAVPSFYKFNSTSGL